MADDKAGQNVTLRHREVSRRYPMVPDSPERKSLVDALLRNYAAVEELQGRISALREAQKPMNKLIDEALHDLSQGCERKVMIQEKIFWDEDRVETIVVDTAELLPDRQITEDDRQMQISDQSESVPSEQKKRGGNRAAK